MMARAAFRVMSVVAARPNMMKVAPLIAELKRHRDMMPVLVHTGQHYDYLMSRAFFEQLDMPEPDHNLEVGSLPQHAQTAEILRRFGEVVNKDRPDVVVVVGDVNSTMACALVAAKENIPLVHVEAGLRSADRTMPEEINRIVTDSISDLFFATEENAVDNLTKENIPAEKIFLVGNLMIDSLVRALPLAKHSALFQTAGLKARRFVVLTLHRPFNVDDVHRLHQTLVAVAEIAREVPVIFPVHPRTSANIDLQRLTGVHRWDGRRPIDETGVWIMPPATYLDFVRLLECAALVITDSGGIQEETTYLGVPCLTYRSSTERPVTISQGTNRLIGTHPDSLLTEAKKELQLDRSVARDKGQRPILWDGRAAERIVSVLRRFLEQRGGSLELSTQV